MIMNMFMFKAAIFLMILVIVREFLRKRYGIDLDKIDVKKFKDVESIKAQFKKYDTPAEFRNSGSKTVILKNVGANKATVQATLRQITGVDYNTAKTLVDSAPSTILAHVNEEQANLTKKALEFVGATVEIK